MKKTIITLMALSGVAGAASVDCSMYEELGVSENLLGAYDFSSSSATKGTLNYSESFTVENGVAVLGEGKNCPWANYMNLGPDWTISFDVLSLGSTNDAWSNILTMYSNTDNVGGGYKHSMVIGLDNQHQVQVSSSNGEETSFNGGEAVNMKTGIYDDGATGNVAKANGQTITLVQDSSANTLTLYVDGVQTQQATGWDPASIVGMQFGKGFAYGRDPLEDATIDNLAIWNTALSKDMVESLIVPEPATATLSLLALAGLAARRRRK